LERIRNARISRLVLDEFGQLGEQVLNRLGTELELIRADLERVRNEFVTGLFFYMLK
jgi:hypothetical protein